MSDINFTEIIESINFVPAQKKQIPYEFINPWDELVPMSYKIHIGDDIEIITRYDGEEETKNLAKSEDYIICGSVGEQYVIKANKFKNLYNNLTNRQIVPKNDQRIVGQYKGTEIITFYPSWHNSDNSVIMILKPNDWLVREDYNTDYNYPSHMYNYRNQKYGFYRIAKAAFNSDYLLV